MTTELLLQIILVGLNHAAELGALYQKAKAENRDLTEDEVKIVRWKALASQDALEKVVQGFPP